MGFMTLHRSFMATPAAGRLETLSPAATVQPVARPYSPPQAVLHSPTVSAVNPAILYMRNPAFGQWTLGDASPRSSFALPVLISPVAPPLDTTLFEDPANANNKYYLSRYAIATQGAGGAQSICVTFAAGADGYDLTVQLADTTDSGVSAGGTRIDPATTRYFLTANLSGLAATWDFGAVTATGSNLTMTLTVTDPQDRDSIYRAMTDASAQARLMIRRSFQVAVPAPPAQGSSQPLYRQSLTAVDSSLPFTFDPVLDRNVFALLGTVGSGQSTWVVTQVPYAPDNRSYPYYQDMRQPGVIYYLPDSFRISRRQAAPHAPNISVTASGGDPSALKFTLSFLATPVWNPQRIANAAAWWQQNLHGGSPPAMHLFEASNTSLQLALPSSDGSGGSTVATQTGAIIDIAGGISCAVTLSLAQLQQVYAALFDEVSQLLSGVVNVTVGSDVEAVHFSWRATDFVGNPLSTTSTYDTTQGQFTVVVADAIESPIHVASLPAAVMKNPGDPAQPATRVADQGQTLTPPPPLDLTPQASSSQNSLTLVIQMVPQNLGQVGNLLLQAISGGSSQAPASSQLDPTNCTVVVDQSHATVKPDASALWDAIMSNQVVGPVQRSVKVVAFASMFAAPSTTKAVQVVFQGGQTVDFDGSTQADSAGLMSQTVTLAVPIKAYVLGSGDTSTYQYRVVLISATGTQQGQWISSNTDSFYVQSSAA
ncbi:MAG TPA: hypothetical protein VIW73_09115 [Candidatus Cybelea sp.]